MSEKALSPERARRIYDRIGRVYGLAESFGGRAKEMVLQGLSPEPGMRLIDVGAGTGRDLLRLQRAVTPGGRVIAVDVSMVMLRLTRARSKAPVCQADARRLPFAHETFDGLCCTYVLDLLPQGDIPLALEAFRRVLKPGGRLALASMTEGVTTLSRALISGWKTVYRLSPALCAGCRPLRLAPVVRAAGFEILTREVLVEFGFPSEVVVAARTD